MIENPSKRIRGQEDIFLYKAVITDDMLTNSRWRGVLVLCVANNDDKTVFRAITRFLDEGRWHHNVDWIRGSDSYDIYREKYCIGRYFTIIISFFSQRLADIVFNAFEDIAFDWKLGVLEY